MRRMKIAASLIALVTFSTVSAFAQSSNSRSARSAALNYVLVHEFAYLTGADFELAGETTDALTPSALRGSQPTDAIQLMGAAVAHARSVRLADVIECPSICRPVGMKPLVLVGAPADSAGLTRVLVQVVQRSKATAGIQTGTSRLTVVLQAKAGGWTAVRTENAVAGTTPPMP
jgi:hypothetical protein